MAHKQLVKLSVLALVLVAVVGLSSPPPARADSGCQALDLSVVPGAKEEIRAAYVQKRELNPATTLTDPHHISFGRCSSGFYALGSFDLADNASEHDQVNSQDGPDLFRRAAGKWQDVTDTGGAIPCDGHVIPADLIGLWNLPFGTTARSVICALRDTDHVGIYCNDSKGGPHLRHKPRRCLALPASASFSQGANLKKLRWKHWGKSVATARGRELGFHLPLQHIRVKVRATRLRRACGNGPWVYTRLRARSRHGVSTVRLDACG